jgi:hypothetical protein
VSLPCFGFLIAYISGFLGPHFRVSRADGFRADPPKSACFIEFYAIYGPFGTPIFSRIFHHFGADFQSLPL